MSNEKKSFSEDVKNEIPEFTQDEAQAAIDKLEKGKASDNNGFQAEDIKTCDATTKEMIRQIFNEVLKQEDCTPETWRRIRRKVIFKSGNVEEVGDYRRFALCQRFTNCSQQSNTTDFTADSTKRNQNTRLDLDVLTKCWTIVQHTDCWNRNAVSGVSKCGSRQWTS